MKEIPLTQGLVALVDDEDYELVSQYEWYASKHRNTYYARRNVTLEDGTRITIRLHREIMNAKPGQQIDHIDGNGLNCQKYNMRFATTHQNNMNAVMPVGVSGYRGVRLEPSGRWLAQLSYKKQRIYGGTYDTPEEAARAYDTLAQQYHGEFAVLNFYAED